MTGDKNKNWFMSEDISGRLVFYDPISLSPPLLLFQPIFPNKHFQVLKWMFTKFLEKKLGIK